MGIDAGSGQYRCRQPGHRDVVSYGEATGITQTIRNYGASLGLAILGTILLSVQRAQLTASLRKLYPGLHDPAQVAASRSQQSQSQDRLGTGSTMQDAFRSIRPIRMDFAHAIEVVLFVMCGIMALAAVVAFIGLQLWACRRCPSDARRECRALRESSADPALVRRPGLERPPRGHAPSPVVSVANRWNGPHSLGSGHTRKGHMPEPTQFTIGTEVSCTDGPCGAVTKVVVNPVAQTVTHLVVEPKHRAGLGRLVPLELVTGPPRRTVRAPAQLPRPSSTPCSRSPRKSSTCPGPVTPDTRPIRRCRCPTTPTATSSAPATPHRL